ncbi:hypothetical protein E3N88_39282 [Mikania micrantha]|uniref:Uncharacterized protein n=1 Tax=Mikania micrantha TaxID=192012 RepID=A0A5N6LX62_9ASTR|nr:hypothetical protein E3N88_39282 [Mikania micrantha]
MPSKMKNTNLPFSAKLFMHTLSMTLLIMLMVTSFQTKAHEPVPQIEPEFLQPESPQTQPSEPEFPNDEPSEPLMFNLDYGDWFGPPNTGGRPDSGPIPHAEVDDEVEDIDSDYNKGHRVDAEIPLFAHES